MTGLLVRTLVRASAACAAFVVAAHVAVVPVSAYARDDRAGDAFLLRLLEAINERRERNGTQRLSFVPSSAIAALDDFFAETAPAITWPGPCMHQSFQGRFSWDVIIAAGYAGAPRGEVLACPGPEPYWTADRAAAQWWDSPFHFPILYADGDSNAIACSAYGVRGGADGRGKVEGSGDRSLAASAVLCVTFRA